MQASAPGLLIAMPNILDPSFSESVVLLLHHDDDGAVGLVANRSFRGCHRRASRLVGLDIRPCDMGAVRAGGPIEGKGAWLLFEKNDRLPERLELGDGLLASSHLEDLLLLQRLGRVPYRVFAGYAGWSAGQLEKELGWGSWLMAPVSRRVLMDVPAEAAYDAALCTLGIGRADLALMGQPARNH